MVTSRSFGSGAITTTLMTRNHISLWPTAQAIRGCSAVRSVNA